MVEFVSYDGEYPNLCSGTLMLSIDGEPWNFPNTACVQAVLSGLMMNGTSM